MRNIINIQGNDQVFPYLIEFSKDIIDNKSQDGDCVNWCNDRNIIRLLDNDIQYYRYGNEWFNTSTLDVNNHQFIPNEVNTSNVRVYLPAHALSTYVRNVKYCLSLNVWINDVKVDLGSFIFTPNDTYAISTGTVKKGNNEYFECIDFTIIDPFHLLYDDAWVEFRNKVCKEPLNINSTSTMLQVSLFIVDEYENRFVIKDGVVGGTTGFCISNYTDYMTLGISNILDPLGIRFDLKMNAVYDHLLDYLSETYGITRLSQRENVSFDLVIKNKDSIIIGPTTPYAANEGAGNATQIVKWINILNNSSFDTFFSSWDLFEEGWNIVGSLNVVKDDEELFTIVSNELPITQELFSVIINGGAKKIIDINDMNIDDLKELRKYTIVNKIENKIVQLERPNDSRSNIVQPVFFRAKETEILTLHPVVTENISINLDDYKSKVDTFILQIGGVNFTQIGSNSYGVIFKIPANKIPANVNSGTYYILNEEMELVTTGKYNCIR